jgi:lipopolysaccharide transport system ATP-binding protein
MSDVAIRVEKLGKMYRIGGPQARYKTLRESIVGAVTAPIRRLRHPRSASRNRETIWALKDVSFEVQRGEVVGIIGRNGAGKTTLLKILSRITEPTEGRAEIHGRVGSLLEVGTGFHPELTGRENIYLNGAILGMGRAEIDRKFDEIVAFAEIKKFLDTPVKHYSSGMYVRLAFAVAAHLEPEILLVDEVLAVGDAAFQKKCLGKMGDVAREGRTVLFVSHNMGAIQRLCGWTVLLGEGKVLEIGNSTQVVRNYLDANIVVQNQAVLPPEPAKTMRLRQIQVLDASGQPVGQVEQAEPFRVRVIYDINRPVKAVHVVCFFQTAEGINLFGTGDADCSSERLELRAPGQYRGEFEVPAFLLNEGQYSIAVSLGVPGREPFDRHENLVSFKVVDCKSQRRQWVHSRRSTLLGLELSWRYEEEPVTA